MDWNAIADKLAAAADTVPDVTGYSEVPDDMANIGFYVGEIDVNFDVTFRRAPVGGNRRGSDEANITCRILVARFDDKGAQRKLREYMSGKGLQAIVQAISADRTLGGTVDDSMVKDMRGNRMFTVGESKFYGVELTVYVIGDA